MQALCESSLMARVVNEEIEHFLERLRARVQAVQGKWQNDDENQNETDAVIKKMLSIRFGDVVASSMVGVNRGANGWNEFTRMNYKSAAEEMSSTGSNSYQL